MIRAIALSFALALALPAIAQDDHHDEDHAAHEDHDGEDHDDHGHDDHVAQADGLRAVHAWTNATDGALALVYVELENTSGQAATLLGAEAMIAEGAMLVGLENVDGELRYAEIPQMPIPAASELVLSPNGLAIQLSGLAAPLLEGESFEIELEFEGAHLDAVVAIEAAGATQHSHAGHQH
ncbi:copper chaperone PCu(A)C [Pelagibacterium montanilacus]|uniref:copper chaperone PCu(A)C n=1 Tax=Pelagibacterium montanilacus TaxID=2185280 RepID=UPI000F8DE827|nr:copper chaperone PCu(A)C [Pelagibacterium montanilacus]